MWSAPVAIPSPETPLALHIKSVELNRPPIYGDCIKCWLAVVASMGWFSGRNRRRSPKRPVAQRSICKPETFFGRPSTASKQFVLMDALLTGASYEREWNGQARLTIWFSRDPMGCESGLAPLWVAANRGGSPESPEVRAPYISKSAGNAARGSC
jgi:hypothetical protein